MGEALEQLIAAVRAGDLETMRAILERQAELVNAAVDLEQRDRPSDTAAMRLIHVAVAENRREALRWLIEHGADLNARNAAGRLALHDCFELGRDDLAQLLLEAGAEADVCAAAAYGMHGRLQEILAGDPVDANDQANDLRTGVSPLGWSAYGNQTQAALILIQRGAIVNRPPYDVEAWGPTAQVANTTFAMMLLGHGANPNCQDEDGDTPIHAAIKSRIVVDAEPFVEILLAAGADCGIRNHAGRTALEEALWQQGQSAETYFPARPIGAKKLDRVIELLR